MIRGQNDIYVYDFETNTITQPYSHVLKNADVRTWERGLHQMLNDGSVFVEESSQIY